MSSCWASGNAPATTVLPWPESSNDYLGSTLPPPEPVPSVDDDDEDDADRFMDAAIVGWQGWQERYKFSWD